MKRGVDVTQSTGLGCIETGGSGMADRARTIERSEPAADRPSIPGYGVPETTEGMLPWTYARERLARAKNYWVGTASRDGRPHAVPVWGAWLDGALYFGAGPRSTRNLEANPRVTVHLESGDEVVIVEGVVEPLLDPDGSIFRRLAEAMAAKYDYRPDEPSGYVLRPRVAYAWSSFPADATRWRFGEE
jgi:nitroimidazol reductase NimA-like FMN-containing flavoprotein (pyridoxamine 5'-phosphate oxidase superfamily)